MMAGCSHKLTPQRRAEMTALYTNCTACHGHQQVQRGPILDGLDASYVETQLIKFKTKVRGTHPGNEPEQLMASVMDLLKDDAEVRDMSFYIASLVPKPYTRTVVGDSRKGQTIYDAQCASCHGKRAEGKRLLKTGSLAVLEDWYVLQQLTQFQAGRRGYHKLDDSGRQMAEALKGLDTDELRDIVVYIGERFGHQHE
jgi:cytochrome c oxidase subunit 2